MPITESKILLFYNNLLKLDHEVEKLLGDKTSCCGITFAQWHVLFELDEIGETSIKHIAEVLDLDKSTLSRTIDNLVHLDLVSRVINPQDRRFMIVRLTEKGKQTIKAMHATSISYFNTLFNNIPDCKHDMIIESIELLTIAMKQCSGLHIHENATKACCGNAQKNDQGK